MKILNLLVYLCIPLFMFAQEPADSFRLLDAVTVSGIQPTVLRNTPFNISVLSSGKMQEGVNYNVSDALAKLPGISQITTGPGISKPVIRGLYGNRVQTVLLGLRFDNQQWQDEHGLGLPIIGIDHIEVLKGPSSLLYGTEAIGGVIRIIEEQPGDPGNATYDLRPVIFSNTYGLSLNGGMKKNFGRKYFLLRLGGDSHADYSDGNNDRVLNSRFESYNLKADYGFEKRRWSSKNHFYSSLSRFGFIMQDNRDRKPIDNRLGRKFDGPYHAVLFNILSSENTVQLENSKLQINGGAHSNLRLENEGGNHVSLNMLLNTFSYNLKWYRNLNAKTELVLGNESQFQLNDNYGSRVIIPDARTFESSVSGYIRHASHRINLEGGLSFNNRHLNSKKTLNMDYSSGEIYPFARWYHSLNGNAGISVNLPSGFNFKANISSGFRAPNLAELSSNGLHEGTFRYEIGNPGMRIEQNLNTEININFEQAVFRFYGAAYVNSFRDYIFLSPTGNELYGFDIYRFRQANATLHGSEIGTIIRPGQKWQTELNYSFVRGKLSHTEYLPFMPADKLSASLSFRIATGITFRCGGDFLSKQNRPAEFETPTDAYWLLRSSVSFSAGSSRQIRITIAGENLLNKLYFDHLSRFKNFGIYNTGGNISLNIFIPFFKSIKTSHV